MSKESIIAAFYIYKNWGVGTHRNLELEVSVGTIQGQPIILWEENLKLKKEATWPRMLERLMKGGQSELSNLS